MSLTVDIDPVTPHAGSYALAGYLALAIPHDQTASANYAGPEGTVVYVDWIIVR